MLEAWGAQVVYGPAPRVQDARRQQVEHYRPKVSDF
jgi:hypothetical protein